MAKKPTISISTYLFSISDQNSTDSLNLKNLPQIGSFMTWLSEKLSANVLREFSEDSRIMQIISSSAAKGKPISALIKTGEYGAEGDIFHKTQKKVTHKKTKEEADLMPFFFLADHLSSEQDGVMLFQRFRNLGVKEAIRNYIVEELNKDAPTLRFRLNTVTPARAIEELAQRAQIKTIILSRKGGKSDIADAYLSDGKIELSRVGAVEVQIVAKRESYLASLKEVLSKNGSINTGLLLSNFENFDSIKIQATIDGKVRTFDASGIETMINHVDVTSEITFGENGHPTELSIESAAKSLLRDLKAQIEGTQNG